MQIIFTWIFIKSGGVYTICPTEKDIVKAEQRFQEIFEKIKNTQKLTIIRGDRRCDFCSFKKDDFKNGLSSCDFFHLETQKMGIDKVTDKYIQIGAGQYGEGGGRSHK